MLFVLLPTPTNTPRGCRRQRSRMSCEPRLKRRPPVAARTPSGPSEAAEREVNRAGVFVLLRVQRMTQLDPNRPERRAPADARPYRIAQVREVEPLLVGEGVAEVGKHHALQIQLLHQREGEFVV